MLRGVVMPSGTMGQDKLWIITAFLHTTTRLSVQITGLGSDRLPTHQCNKNLATFRGRIAGREPFLTKSDMTASKPKLWQQQYVATF